MEKKPLYIINTTWNHNKVHKIIIVPYLPVTLNTDNAHQIKLQITAYISPIIPDLCWSFPGLNLALIFIIYSIY